MAYPWWFVVFCVLAGALFSGIVYYKNNRYELSRRVKITCAVLRFLGVSLLAFLLLAPVVKNRSRQVEKPLVIVGLDNSLSNVLIADSAYYRNEFPQQAADFIGKLSEKYDVCTYTLGAALHTFNNELTFDEPETNLSAFFEEVKSVYAHRNLSAVVLASDGIYNKGSNPLYAAEQLSCPVYTVAMGDSNLTCDLFIDKINYNKTSFLGNDYPVEILIAAHKLKGKQSKLTVCRAGEVLTEKVLHINTDKYFDRVQLFVHADKVGVQHLQVELEAIEGEVTPTNNKRSVFVEVVDKRQKVLIAYAAPHPDVSAIRQALEASQTYQVEVAEAAAAMDKNIAEYGVVVLFGLPSLTARAGNLLTQLQTKHIPVFYILGDNIDYTAFNALNVGLTCHTAGENRSHNEVLPAMQADFSFFNLSEDTKHRVADFPPLISPFGNYAITGTASALFMQQIGNVSTNYPLWLFAQNNTGRAAVLTASGIYKWRLADFRASGNHEAFDELVSKTVQYLGVEDDKSYFRVHAKKMYDGSEPLIINAEVYNASYEPVNTSDVYFTLYEEDSHLQHDYIFSKSNKAYYLNLGNLPTGTYRWEAHTKEGGQTHKASGMFYIQQQVLDAANLTADHTLLRNMASRSHAQAYTARGLSELADQLLNHQPDAKPVVYYSTRYTSLLDVIWLLLFIVALFAAEWVLRKRNGI